MRFFVVLLLIGILVQCGKGQGYGVGYAQMVQDGFGFGVDEQFIAFRGGDSQLKDTSYILVWHGCVFAADGICEESRSMIKALYTYGIQFVVSAIDTILQAQVLSNEENTFFNHLLVDPEKLRKNNPGKVIVAINHGPAQSIAKVQWADITIIRTAWEVSPFPAQFLAAYEQSEVWVSSEFNKKSLKDAGYAAENIYVIGQCADEHYENFSSSYAIKIPEIKKFNFLSVFNWNYRKGWDVLVQAFLEEFSARDDVALILKIYSSKSFEENKQQLRNFISEKFPEEKNIPDRIILLNEAFSTADMPLVYKAADAFVLPTRGEGWGRTAMEAMLLQIPVIATRCSGLEEFVTSKTAYPIPYKYENVPLHAEVEFPLFANSKWAEPDLPTLRKHMRKVYQNPKEAAKKAEKAKKWFLDKYSRYQIAKEISERIDTIVSNYQNTK